jgi:hypothetical protein
MCLPHIEIKEGIPTLDDAALMRLRTGLFLALEDYAAHLAPSNLRNYKTTMGAIETELRKVTNVPAAEPRMQEFLGLIGEWVKKVQVATGSPTSVDTAVPDTSMEDTGAIPSVNMHFEHSIASRYKLDGYFRHSIVGQCELNEHREHLEHLLAAAL